MRNALLLSALLSGVLTLSLASLADAAYPGQRPADARVQAEVAIALSYWAAQGVTGCPNGVTAYIADSLLDGDGDAAGRGGDCSIWLRAANLAGARDPGWSLRQGAMTECRIVYHEVGHALGLPHTDTPGVMHPVITTTPLECRQWALSLYPKRVRLGRTMPYTLHSVIHR